MGIKLVGGSHPSRFPNREPIVGIATEIVGRYSNRRRFWEKKLGSSEPPPVPAPPDPHVQPPLQ